MERKEKIIYWVLVPLLSALLPVLLGWQELARRNGWVPLNECPGEPINLSIQSPVDGLHVPNKGSAIIKQYNTEIVFEASRPVDEGHDIGILTKGEKDTQYHLSFPGGTEKLTDRKFRIYSFDIRVDDESSGWAEIRVLIGDDWRSFGQLYINGY